MQMRLDMPYLDRTAASGTLRKWFKDPGDTIAPGEHICEIVTSSRTVLDIPRNAKLLTRLSKRKVETTARQLSNSIAWRVIAREPGTMHTISAGFDTVEVGDTLAIITVMGGDESETSDTSAMPEFRAYCEMAPEEGDEGN